MNIKSLLLGSAAALAAVSGAHAADAIVAAEPEAMEYVRVCDAFGKGYFYIPGTETCLKIGGRVRTELRYAEDNFASGGDIDSYTHAYLTFAAKSDTEFGTLSGYINLQFNDGANADVTTINDGAWINIAGFDIGYFYNWWDEYGLKGEGFSLGGNLLNSARYTYDGGSFRVGASVEELENNTAIGQLANNPNDNIGVSGLLGGTIGGVDALVIGSYDFDRDEAAFKARLTADIGPGTFGIAGIYATDPNAYWNKSQWTVAGSYSLKATDKLTITPGVQYFGDVDFVYNNDAWRVSLAAGYQITEGLSTLASISYTDVDVAGSSVVGNGQDSEWKGFLRLQRDF